MNLNILMNASGKPLNYIKLLKNPVLLTSKNQLAVMS